MKNQENIYETDYVKDLFNRMSISYERVNYITSFGFSIRWRKQFLKVFPKSDEKLQAIDLLAGMGETWDGILNRWKNIDLDGLDISTGMLQHAHHKNKTRFNSKVTVYQQDVLNSELQSEHYDFVFCCFGLKTFDREQISLLAKEVKRILKLGGKLSFIEVSVPKNKILRSLYQLHLGTIVPFWGKLLLGNPEEYKMLWKYTSKFENVDWVMEEFEKEGLKLTKDSYFWGCATGFHGTKL